MPFAFNNIFGKFFGGRKIKLDGSYDSDGFMSSFRRILKIFTAIELIMSKNSILTKITIKSYLWILKYLKLDN